MALKITGPDPIGGAREILEAAGRLIDEERALDHGKQFRLSGGGVVNVYHSGAVVSQGRDQAALTALFSGAAARAIRPNVPASRAPAKVITPQALAPSQPDHGGERRHPDWKPDWSDWDGYSPPW